MDGAEILEGDAASFRILNGKKERRQQRRVKKRKDTYEAQPDGDAAPGTPSLRSQHFAEEVP